MKGEGTPLKRRQITFLMLPDDLVFNCLARVSRLYYPILSLVSKRFRSLVASTELYQMRNLLGHTESCLYVCLRLYHNSYPLRWFTLCQRPHSSKKILVPISSLNSPSALFSEVAVVGPNIYVIGGNINRMVDSSSLMIMDYRSHKWLEAPSMRVARKFRFQSACILDGKIYVTGGCQNLDSTNWMEVFDTRTQTWEFLQIPSEEICGGGSEYKVVRYEGTIYVRSEEKKVAYKLYKGRWRMADLAMNYGWGSSSSYCVIENVFYRYVSKNIEWYDSKQRAWTTLKGLEILLPSLTFSGHVKFMDYGGKMLLLWSVYCGFRESRQIWWCAEITIEQRLKGEIWGMVEWYDVVDFAINEPFGLEHALTTII